MLIKIDGPSSIEDEKQNKAIVNLKERINKKKNELDSLNKQIDEYNSLQEELSNIEVKKDDDKKYLDKLIKRIG